MTGALPIRTGRARRGPCGSRASLGIGGAAGLALLVAGCAGARPEPLANVRPAAPAERVAAVVDASYVGVEGNPVGGIPTFRSVGAALAAAPPHAAESYRVRVRAGRYPERVSIERPDVHLLGDGAGRTVLTHSLASGHVRPDGAPYGTRGSYTLRVAAPGFRLEGMRVENAFDYPANAALPEGDPGKVTAAQAVAVLLDRGSDRAAFRDCAISGYQDTLFADAGRAHFLRCTILGHVDFVFGAGQAVFEESDIVSRDRGSRTNGYIAAPSTLLSSPHGFLFLRSRLRKEHPGMAAGSVALGRPWHPGGDPQAVGSTVFIDCHMDDHISAAGWAPMSGFPAEEARFFEHGSSGPGAIASESRRRLPDAAVPYHVAEQVLRGWRAFPEETP